MENMIDTDLEQERDFLDDFAMSRDVAELAVVDDLWYLIKKGGNWIVGSG